MFKLGLFLAVRSLLNFLFYLPKDIEELLQPAEMGWGTHERTMPAGAVKVY